jgi:hypothetical protein
MIMSAILTSKKATEDGKREEGCQIRDCAASGECGREKIEQHKGHALKRMCVPEVNVAGRGWLEGGKRRRQGEVSLCYTHPHCNLEWLSDCSTTAQTKQPRPAAAA